jgi:hypothetical protein
MPARSALTPPFGVLIVDLAPDGCRFPVGHDGEGRRNFCGAPVDPPKPLGMYCCAHHAVCYAPSTPGASAAIQQHRAPAMSQG